MDKFSLQILNEFQYLVAPIKLPQSLIELAVFDKSRVGQYATGFYIENDNSSFFKHWMEEGYWNKEQEKKHAKSIVLFANADGTGSKYAFYLYKGITDLETAPIIYYSSEGEVDLVADNLRDLIKMLSFGAEYMSGFEHDIFHEEDEAYFFFEEFMENNPYFLEFREWMQKTLDIQPVNIEFLKTGKYDGDMEYAQSKEVNTLLKKAKNNWKEKFDDWKKDFYPKWDNLEEEYFDLEEERHTKLEEEREKLLKQIKKKPTANSYYELAELELELSDDYDLKKISSYYEKCLALNPKHTYALESYTSILEENSKFNKAIELYLKHIQAIPKPEDYYFDIGNLYENIDDLEKALLYYIKAVESDKKIEDNFSQDSVVEICEALGKDAIIILDLTLDKNPKNYETIKTIYQLYFDKKEYQKAKEYAIKYIENSNEHRIRNYQGLLYSEVIEAFKDKGLTQEAKEIEKICK